MGQVAWSYIIGTVDVPPDLRGVCMANGDMKPLELLR